MTDTIPLMDSQKIQIVRALPSKIEHKWNALSTPAKREVFERDGHCDRSGLDRIADRGRKGD